MALVLSNRVQETGTANTTVSFTLAGAVSGFQTFTAGVGNGNTTYYSATDSSGNWEVGLGTFSSTGPTLTRTTIYSSSNSGSAVTFSGTVNVFVTYPAEKSVSLNASGNVSSLGTVSSGTWQGSIVGVTYGGTGTATPGIVAGTNISVSGTWPNQTIANTAPAVACATPFAAGIVYGQTCFGSSKAALGTAAIAGATNTVAIGASAYAYSCSTVVVGKSAEATNQLSYTSANTTVIGANAFATASPCAVVIGKSAYAYSCLVCTCFPVNAANSTVIGAYAGSNYTNAVVIGSSVTSTGACQTHIGPVRSTGSTSGLQGLYYNPCTKEVIQGAAGLSGTVPIASGGTGQTTQQAALNALSGTQTANRVLRSNGTNVTLSQVALGTDVSGTLPVANGGTGQTSYTNGQLLIGNTTGNTLAKATLTAGCGIAITNGSGSITISASGGSVPCATPTSTGVVYGVTGSRIALGQNAYGGCNSVTIGKHTCSSSGAFGSNSIGIGSYATTCGSNAIAIGTYASAYPANSIAIGPSVSATCACQTHIGPIRSVCSTSGLQGLFYCNTTKEVIQGAAASVACATPTSAGIVYGKTDTCGAQTALGISAGTTGQGNYAVAIGYAAGAVNQGARAIAIGPCAGGVAQPSNSIAIGWNVSATCACQTHIGPIRCVAGATSGLNSLYYNSSTKELVQGVVPGGCAVGCATPFTPGIVFGRTFSSYGGATNLGYSAGGNFQGCFSVAIGGYAGNYQGSYAVAVGADSGRCCQGNYAVAVGYNSGQFFSGCYSVSIGANTGAGCATGSNAIGSGTFVSFMGSNQTHIGPIRSSSGPYTLYYCPCSREVTYS